MSPAYSTYLLSAHCGESNQCVECIMFNQIIVADSPAHRADPGRMWTRSSSTLVVIPTITPPQDATPIFAFHKNKKTQTHTHNYLTLFFHPPVYFPCLFIFFVFCFVLSLFPGHHPPKPTSRSRRPAKTSPIALGATLLAPGLRLAPHTNDNKDHAARSETYGASY